MPEVRYFEIVIAFLPFWLQNHVCTLVRPPAVDIIDELQFDISPFKLNGPCTGVKLVMA